MILKNPIDQKSFSNNLIFTKNARKAWEHILMSFKHSNIPLNILMPSYIGYTEREGSGVFDPVKSQMAYAEFYELNSDLTINDEHFEELINTKKFTIVLVIHYFGFCRNNMTNIRKLCDENKVILVEDCAHAFYLYNSISNIGNYGHYSFFSIHKYLATDSGGILKINNEIVPIIPNLIENKINSSDSDIYMKSKFDMISQKRRDNYKKFEILLSNNPNFSIIYKLEENDIPQTFALRVKNQLREKLYFFLMENSAPTTALYYQLIQEISPIRFPESHLISKEILNLPVHQDTNMSDIEKIVLLINDFYNKQI